jgi:hypothetical protein
VKPTKEKTTRDLSPKRKQIIASQKMKRNHFIKKEIDDLKGSKEDVY